KEYASLLLLQLVQHGPPVVTPSNVNPSTQYSLSGSAQPAPLYRGPFAFAPMYRFGRPASSLSRTVFDSPSATGEIFSGPVAAPIPDRLPTLVRAPLYSSSTVLLSPTMNPGIGAARLFGGANVPVNNRLL